MDKPTYQVSGRVTRSDNKAGIHGLCVEVWEKDGVDDHFLGSDLTRHDGTFRVRVSEEDSRLQLEQVPDVFLVIKD